MKNIKYSFQYRKTNKTLIKMIILKKPSLENTKQQTLLLLRKRYCVSPGNVIEINFK
jgi:hypothetical protein